MVIYEYKILLELETKPQKLLDDYIIEHWNLFTDDFLQYYQQYCSKQSLFDVVLKQPIKFTKRTLLPKLLTLLILVATNGLINNRAS